MNKDIKLYIKNKKVDLSDKISFPFQYQFEDLNNPSIVKNNFSKIKGFIAKFELNVAATANSEETIFESSKQ